MVLKNRSNAGGKINRKCPIRYFIFPLSILLLFLTWQGIERYNSYKDYQLIKMQQSVTGAGAELSESLKRLNHAISVFMKDHLPLIQELADSPDNDNLFNELKTHTKEHFPDYFAVTITDPSGIPLIPNFDLTVNELCQKEILLYIKSGYKNNIYIHPHVDAYHFDMLSQWNYKSPINQKGIFFISIKPIFISQVLRNSQLLDHKLILLRNDMHGLIEVTAEGTRLETNRPEEIRNIGYSMPIAGTQWDLSVLPDPDLLVTKRNNIVMQTIVMFFVISFLGLFFLWIFRKEEDLRYKFEKNLSQTQEQLEHALLFSNVATWQYNLRTNIFTWSANASNLFDGRPPKTREEYLTLIDSVFENDFELFIHQCEKQDSPQHLEYNIATKSPDNRWLEISGSHKNNALNHPEILIGLLQNVTDRKIAENNYMLFELKQKDTLLREVHHRIKNNLQGIMNLLQQHKNKKHFDKSVLDHAVTQLNSVSIIHGIQGSAANNKIELSNLVSMISTAAFEIIGIKYKPTHTITGSFFLNTLDNNTISIALIVNELIFNAIKYTPESKVHDIKINVISFDDGAAIQIFNPGNPLPDDFDFMRGSGLGTGLTLTKSLLPKKGTHLTINQTTRGIVTKFVLSSPVLEVAYDTESRVKQKTA